MKARYSVTLLLFIVGLLQALPARAQSDVRTDSSNRVEKAKELFFAGQKAFQEGDLKTALYDFQEANRLVPSAELAYDIGRICRRMGDTEQAIWFLRLYLSRAGSSATDREEIQTQIEQMRKEEHSLREEMLNSPPQVTAQARGYFEQGMAMFENGRYHAALIAFTAAQRLFPLPELSYNMALASERLGRKSDAIDYYSAYLKARPDAPDRKDIENKIRNLQKELRSAPDAGN